MSRDNFFRCPCNQTPTNLITPTILVTSIAQPPKPPQPPRPSNHLDLINHINHVNHLSHPNHLNYLSHPNHLNHPNHFNYLNHLNQVNQLKCIVCKLFSSDPSSHFSICIMAARIDTWSERFSGLFTYNLSIWCMYQSSSCFINFLKISKRNSCTL